MSDVQARVRAPALVGAGGWLNTGGAALSLAELRGKVVLLDFWTFCCVNCLHVLDELRPLEDRFADVLVVIGVHSPKFAHEADHGAVVAAVERYGVHHPVLDDPGMVTWDQYAVRAWPTLVVVDPEGYVVQVASGEGHGAGLAQVVEDLVATHDAKRTLPRGDGRPRRDVQGPRGCAADATAGHVRGPGSGGPAGGLRATRRPTPEPVTGWRWCCAAWTPSGE